MGKSEVKPTAPGELGTAELVDLARKQAVSGQKPDDAILNELKARYGWPDCPNEDSALIADLDRSILMPLFGGHTHLPPRIRKILGAKKPPVPFYYQKLQEETGSPMNVSLKKLRDQLTNEQRKLINSFWKNYLETGFWPLRIDVHRKYTKGKVFEHLRSTGGNPAYAGHIVHEDQAQGPIYGLSLIGILLTKDGEKYERWLLRLLEFFRKKFYQQKKEGQTSEFDKFQIGQALKLSDKNLTLLGSLTRFTMVIQIQSHGHTIGLDWKISPPYNIDELPPTGPLDAYFEKTLFKYFNSPKWVFADDAHSYRGAFTHIPTIGNNLVAPFAAPPMNPNNHHSESVKIFISHSSHDRKLLEALTDLLKAAFALRARDILCTSVPGHKLPGGTDTEDALLGLLKSAKLLIGVLTPASLGSSYVLFELGARWGLKQPLISLVACGVTMGNLQEPLKSKNALNAADENDVRQLIEDVASHLGLEIEPTPSYSKKVHHFVSVANFHAT